MSKHAKLESKVPVIITENEKTLIALFILKYLDESAYDQFKSIVMEDGISVYITRRGEKDLLKLAYEILQITKIKNPRPNKSDTRYIG